MHEIGQIWFKLNGGCTVPSRVLFCIAVNCKNDYIIEGTNNHMRANNTSDMPDDSGYVIVDKHKILDL